MNTLVEQQIGAHPGAWQLKFDREPEQEQKPRRKHHAYCVATPEAQPENKQTWQSQAVDSYTGSIAERAAAMHRELDARIFSLTGSRVPGETIYSDGAQGLAVATLDGTKFQLQYAVEGSRLVIVAPCTYCGTNSYSSNPIHDLHDLGHALHTWQPYCPGCEPQDPAE